MNEMGQAQWIWFAEERAENHFMLARRTFSISGRVCTCKLAISADSHYKVYVNGSFLRRGPVRGVGGHFYYDLIDVAAHLRPGDNVISVLAHQRYRRQGKLLVHGCVDLEGEPSVPFDTGITPWRVSSAPAWSTDVRAAAAGPEVGYQEVLDLRQLPENWVSVGFDDSAWSVSTVVGDAARAAFSLRDIPPLSEAFIPERPAILRACILKSGSDAFGIDLGKVQGATEYVGCRVLAAKDTILEFTAVGDGNLAVFIDGTCVAFRPKDTPEKVQPLVLDLARGEYFLVLRLGKGTWTWTTTFSAAPNELVQYSPEGREFKKQPDCWQALRPSEPVGDWPIPGASVAALSVDAASSNEDAHTIQARLNVAQRMTWEQVIRDLPTPSAFPLEIPAQITGQCTAIVVDLGKECVGFPVLELTSEEDEAVIDLGYGEFLVDGLVPASHYVNHFADRVTLRRGRQIFEPSFWWKGCRYIQLHIRNAAPMTVHDLRFRECRYPAEPAGHFTCSDPVLNDIWRVGVRTLQCCMGDAYMDCPSREQKDYLGDGVPQSHVNYYTVGDKLLAANLLRQFVRLQRLSGFFGEGPGNILDQNLDFVIILWLGYKFTGERGLLEEFYEPSRKLIHAFARHLNADGLLQNLSGSCWVDHELWDFHDEDRSGVRTRLDLRFYRALRDIAAIAIEMGQHADSLEFQALANRVRAGINRLLWDSQRHLYMDGIQKGKPQTTISLHVNYLAILYDVAPRERWEAMYQAMIDPNLKAARSFSPFFHYYVHRALFKMGKPERVLAYLHEYWGGFLRMGLTTFPEGMQPSTDSRCHAYSCTPNVDLAADIVGVVPVDPGFRSFAICPRPDLLPEMSASFPTPHGNIGVEWMTSEEFVDFSLTVPPDTRARFTQGKIDEVLLPGAHHRRLARDA